MIRFINNSLISLYFLLLVCYMELTHCFRLLHKSRFRTQRLIIVNAYRKESVFHSNKYYRYITSTSPSKLEMKPKVESADVWWMKDQENKGKGLNFQCTGCGKCCQNEGEVWLDIDEFVDMCKGMNLSHESFMDTYADSVRSDWVKLKDRTHSQPNGGEDIESCIFLGNDMKSCSVYEHRPIQCRSYPFWPRLLASNTNWNDESVPLEEVRAVANEETIAKKWSSASGGCEGVNIDTSLLLLNASSSSSTLLTVGTLVSTNKISMNLNLYSSYVSNFPFMRNSYDDKERLLSKAGVVASIVASTTAWVREVVLQHDLCPFAQNVFDQGSVRYRVCLQSKEASKIIDKLQYEILALLTSPMESVSTTLLVLPFAFPDFADFHAFSTQLEGAVIAGLNQANSAETASKPGLRSVLAKKPKEEPEGQNDIQLAFFHPGFQWADTEYNDPINFEKRSPFPTINLLRSSVIRKYANEAKSGAIADKNEKSLEAAGSQYLTEKLESIIRLSSDAEDDGDKYF